MHRPALRADVRAMTPQPIAIRRAAPTDAAAFARIMGHPDVLANLMQTP